MDRDLKACVFGVLVLAVYIVHQVTVGGDGAILAGVLGALGTVGGYVLGRVKS